MKLGHPSSPTSPHFPRTPLNTIHLGLRVLEENLKSLKDINGDSDQNKIVDGLLVECQELVDELDGNSSLAVTTLNDLINYDKIETKKFSIDKKPVDMWAVVEKTVNLLTLQAKEKKVTLRLKSQLRNPSFFSTPGTQTIPNLQSLRVIGDVMKLGQVIRNLVSNALKFTPAEGIVHITGTVSAFSCLTNSSQFVSNLNMFQSPPHGGQLCRPFSNPLLLPLNLPLRSWDF